MSNDSLSPDWVRLTYHRDFGDGRMFVQHSFHFLRRDVASAANDDLLFATGEPVVTVGVLSSQVTGAEPTLIEGCTRGVRILPVPFHQVWPPDVDLPNSPGLDVATARVNQPEFKPVAWLPDRSHANLAKPVPGYRGDLGGAISLTHRGEGSLKGLLKRRRDAVPTATIKASGRDVAWS